MHPAYIPRPMPLFVTVTLCQDPAPTFVNRARIRCAPFCAEMPLVRKRDVESMIAGRGASACPASPSRRGIDLARHVLPLPRKCESTREYAFLSLSSSHEEKEQPRTIYRRGQAERLLTAKLEHGGCTALPITIRHKPSPLFMQQGRSESIAIARVGVLVQPCKAHDGRCSVANMMGAYAKVV